MPGRTPLLASTLERDHVAEQCVAISDGESCPAGERCDIHPYASSRAYTPLEGLDSDSGEPILRLRSGLCNDW